MSILWFLLLGGYVALVFTTWRPTDRCVPTRGNQTVDILLAGQSNAVGVPERYARPPEFPVVPIFTRDGWRDLNAAVGHFGPELGIARAAPNATLAKVALGGTMIRQWGLGTPLFESLCRVPLSHNCTLAWVQGESDAFDCATAVEYETELTRLITSIRHHTTCADPYVVAALVRPSSRMPYAHLVNRALTAVAHAVVDTTNLTLSDSIHYDGASLTMLGEELGRRASIRLSGGLA